MNLGSVEVQLGSGLLSLVRSPPAQQRFQKLLHHLRQERNLQVPDLRFRKTPSLPICSYRLLHPKGSPQEGSLRVDRLLVIGPEEKLEAAFKQPLSREATHQLPSVWVEPHQLVQAQRAGCLSFTPLEVLGLHLSAFLQNKPTVACPSEATSEGKQALMLSAFVSFLADLLVQESGGGVYSREQKIELLLALKSLQLSRIRGWSPAEKGW